MTVSPQCTDEELQATVSAYKENGNNQTATAAALGLARSSLQGRLRTAAKKGMMLDYPPAMPGFHVTRVNDGPNGKSVEQKPEPGEIFVPSEDQILKKLSVLTNGDGREVLRWSKLDVEAQATVAAIRTVVDELKKELPRVPATYGPAYLNSELLNQFTVTDLHFGMMAWKEETGSADYDLKIAEKLLIEWFSAAIAMSPNAKVAVLAQLGDLMHHDSHESVTPTRRHVLDADSRLQKVIRVVVRVVRQIIAMLLRKHEFVHVVMADANHDPASSAWMRELLHSMYEDEPRITIDNSPSTYYAYEHGQTGLFYHHGHNRKIGNVDDVFAGKFREIFGRCLQCYGHVGHLHSDAVVETNLMKVERHRTLAPADAYSAKGGWLSGRDAKVITYHKQFGEVGRSIISPRMLAANDNEPITLPNILKVA